MEQLKLDIEDNVVTKFTMTPHLKNRTRQILSILRDRDWITVEELSTLTGYDKQGSISALCRNLRKKKHGSHKVIGRYNKNKIYEYRLIEEDVK